jgi:Glycosyltransferase family 87
VDHKLNLASWITARRIRMHGLLLALALWSVYAVDMSKPGWQDRFGLIKGTDFLQFYTLGALALHGCGDLLYDMQAQSIWMQKVVPAAKNSVYPPLYGPQVSLFFEPFARLPYAWALAAWLILNLLIYSCCCYLIWRICPNLRNHRLEVTILALAFPGLFHLLTFGQTSGVALLCFLLAYLALRTNKRVLAGLAIGCLAFKPQLGVAAAVVFLLTAEWKIVFGAIVGSAFQLGIGWGHFGTPIMRQYFHALFHANDFPFLLDPHLHQTFSLRGFWLLLIPFPRVAFVLYVLSAATVLALAVMLWWSSKPLALRYSGLLLATILAAPHCNVYDLIILAPAFLLLGDWALGQPASESADVIKLLLYASFLLFLLEPLTRIIHVQLGVFAILGLFWITCRATVNSVRGLAARAEA